MSAAPPPRLSGPSFAAGCPGRPGVGRPLSANVRKLHGALGSLLSDSERLALLGRLREYQARRNVHDLVTALRDLRLDCPPRRHLLPLLRQVLPAADQLLFDTYTSRGSCLGQQQGAAARDGRGGGAATTLPIRVSYNFPSSTHASFSSNSCVSCGRATEAEIRPHLPTQTTNGPHQPTQSRQAVPPQASVRRVLLERGSRGAPAPLGLSVRGGAEHGLPVAVGHVAPDSLAWQCGLRPGDLILRANGVVLHNGVTHQDAVRVLRSGRRLDLTVLSVPPATEAITAGAAAPPPPPPPPHHRHRAWGDAWWGHAAEAGGGGGPPPDRPGGREDCEAPGAEERGSLRLLSNGEERKVSVFPASGRAPLGLVVRGGSDFGLGIFVSGLDPGGAAESAGLQVGDQIVEVNGRCLRSASHAEAVAALGASAHLMLTVRDVGRLPRAPAVPRPRSAPPPRRRPATDDDAEPAPVVLCRGVCGTGVTPSALCEQPRRALGERAALVLGGPAGRGGGARLEGLVDEYRAGGLTVPALLARLDALLHTPEQRSLLQDVRALVSARDLDEFDSLLRAAPCEAARAWGPLGGGLRWGEGANGGHGEGAEGAGRHWAGARDPWARLQAGAAACLTEDEVEEVGDVVPETNLDWDPRTRDDVDTPVLSERPPYLHPPPPSPSSPRHQQHQHQQHQQEQHHHHQHQQEDFYSLDPAPPSMPCCTCAATPPPPPLPSAPGASGSQPPSRAQSQERRRRSSHNNDGVNNNVNKNVNNVNKNGHHGEHREETRPPRREGPTPGPNLFGDEEGEGPETEGPRAPGVAGLRKILEASLSRHGGAGRAGGGGARGGAELLAHAGRRPPAPFPADVASVALSSSPSSVASSLAKRGLGPGGSVSSSGASSVAPLAVALAAASSSPSSARPSDPGYSSASRGRGSPLRRCSSSSSPSSSSTSSSPPASPSSRHSGKAPNGGAAHPRTLVLPRATSPTVPPQGTGSLPPPGPGEPGSRSPAGPAGLTEPTTPGVAVAGKEERRNVRFVTVEVHRPNAEPDVNQETALPRSRDPLPLSAEPIRSLLGAAGSEAARNGSHGGDSGGPTRPPGMRDGATRRVRVPKCAPTLGIAIEGGAHTRQPLPRIVTVQEGGSAHASGLLRVGQLLLEVDGTSLRDLQHHDAARAIALAFREPSTSHISFLVADYSIAP